MNFRITLRGQNHRRLQCLACNLQSDWSVVDVARTQNQLRWMIAVLYKMPVGKDGNGNPIHAVDGLYELAVTYDETTREYRLWTYTRNWQGRGGWYAGMIHAEKVRLNRKPKRRKLAA